MKKPTSLNIAGINFSINSPQSITIKELDPVYKSFFGELDIDQKAAKIPTTFHLEKMPDTQNLVKIFECEQFDIMLSDGKEYFVISNYKVNGEPLWLARFTRNFDNITIFCSKPLISIDSNCTSVTNPLRYPLDQILLMYVLSQKNGALFHAAGINVKGRSLIFPGKSGAGKSTIARQLTQSKDIELLSDDRIVVRKINDEFMAYGTPWPGEAGIAENRSELLTGILFIKHASANKIKEITPREALERLMPVTSIPWYDKETVPKLLDFCEDLVANIPTYELNFKPTVEVVDVLESCLSI